MAWAGLLPEDEPYAQIEGYWTGKKRWFCYGDNDPFITQERIEGFQALLSANKLIFEKLVFEGGHEVPEVALRALEQQAAVPHHLIDIVQPSEDYSVAQYVDAAHAKIAEIRGRGREALFVGGTPLYLKALLRGLFERPPGSGEPLHEIEREVE